MQRFVRVLAGCWALLAVCGAAQAGDLPDFELSFAGPSELSGAPGSNVSGDYTVILTQSGVFDGGAQGWSISIAAGGALEIESVTTAGTAAAPVFADPPGLQNGGFEKTETTDPAISVGGCEGASGAVSAVVLSFTMPITLDPESATPILSVSTRATAPDAGSCADGSLAFESGCRGSGQPVDNNITYNGQTVNPAGVTASVQVCGVEVVSCPRDEAGTQIIIQSESLGEVGEAFAGALTPVGSEEPAVLASDVAPGARGAVAVYAAITSNLDSGVQGWSLSAAVGGDVTLVSATTAGTASAPVFADPPGLQNGGFEKTETVDPSKNGQGQGAVSAVVLSFTMPITLLPVGTATVLALEIESAVDQPEGEDGLVAGSVSWVDGLQGSGQPVQNVATVSGSTETFLCCQNAAVLFRTVVDARNDFWRGNANDDNKVDIADPIYLVNNLFRAGPEISCLDAADANDDGNVDLTDATYLIDYLFRGGSEPPAPFGACGKDGGEEGEDDDGLGCDADQSICG